MFYLSLELETAHDQLEHNVEDFLQVVKDCKSRSYIFPTGLVKFMHFREAEVSCNG